MNKLNWLKSAIGAIWIVLWLVLTQLWYDVPQDSIQELLNSLLEIVNTIMLVWGAVMTFVWLAHKYVKKYAPWSKLDMYLWGIDNQK